MGQKVNPLVFRLNTKNKNWNSTYYAKNFEESSYYLYQNLEIKKYLTQIFEANNMIIYKCHITRSDISLNININFYITSKIKIKNIKPSNNLLKIKKKNSKSFINTIRDLKNRNKKINKINTQKKDIKKFLTKKKLIKQN